MTFLFFLWQIWPDRPVVYAKLNSILFLLPFLFFFRTTLTGSNESNDGGKCAECHKVQELLSFLWLKGFSTFPSDLFRSARTSSWAFDPSVRPPVHNNFSLSNGESPWYFPSSFFFSSTKNIFSFSKYFPLFSKYFFFSAKIYFTFPFFFHCKNSFSKYFPSPPQRMYFPSSFLVSSTKNIFSFSKYCPPIPFSFVKSLEINCIPRVYVV